jgi:creatinine amidohydrolase
MSWMQVEAYLETDDRCVVPLGSTEQHAYLSLATDAILSERVAAEAAGPLGVPVLPVLAYGITPYFMAYPGTVTLSASTYERVVVEILQSLTRQGFRRILVVNGHGGNAGVRPALDDWAKREGDLALQWHDWWKAPLVRAAVDEIDADASHASWMENFAWTRLDGVELPAGHKPPVDVPERLRASAEDVRRALGDGSFGGFYQRPAHETDRVWSIAVAETRELLAKGWPE